MKSPCSKKRCLGRQARFAKHVPFKYPLESFRSYLVRQVTKSGISVRLNMEVSAGDLVDFDTVIVAVGSEPIIPPIPGAEDARPAVDVFGREAELGEKVVVVGGGQVGCETALHLARMGRDVVLLEMQSELAPDASPTWRETLVAEVAKIPGNLHVVLGACCTAITPGRVTFEANGRERFAGERRRGPRRGDAAARRNGRWFHGHDGRLCAGGRLRPSALRRRSGERRLYCWDECVSGVGDYGVHEA